VAFKNKMPFVLPETDPRAVYGFMAMPCWTVGISSASYLGMQIRKLTGEVLSFGERKTFFPPFADASIHGKARFLYPICLQVVSRQARNDNHPRK